MSEDIKVAHAAGPAIVGTGRKRGRPRKDESRGSESAGKKHHGSHSGDIPIGQAVTGVLDGRFDAGYMLTVRVANTGTVLRGVVFQPGQFLPVSPTNDIAPHLKMVPRAEVSIPAFPETLHQTPAKDRVRNATPFASPEDKGAAAHLTSTVVVPVTLTPNLPLGQSETLESKYDLKIIPADCEMTPDDPADIACLSSASDSKNIQAVQSSDDKKPGIAAPEAVKETMATPPSEGGHHEAAAALMDSNLA